MKEPDKYLDQLAHDVIGAAIEVPRTLGPGFLESVYEEALCIELKLRNFAFERQPIIGLSYKGYSVGENRLDILVENCLIVELKAVEALEPIHKAQVISYLKATGHLLGLLINFKRTNSEKWRLSNCLILNSWRSWRLGGSIFVFCL